VIATRAAPNAHLVRDDKDHRGLKACATASDKSQAARSRHTATTTGQSSQGQIALDEDAIGSPTYHSSTATMKTRRRGETTRAEREGKQVEMGHRQPGS